MSPNPSSPGSLGQLGSRANDLTITSDGNVRRLDHGFGWRCSAPGSRRRRSTSPRTANNVPPDGCRRPASTSTSGFMTAKLSGFAGRTVRSTQRFRKRVARCPPGSPSRAGIATEVSSADGVEGSFLGHVCIIVCATDSGSLRSDGKDRRAVTFDRQQRRATSTTSATSNAGGRCSLATGAVRVDLNNDGDYDDFGESPSGLAPSADTTDHRCRNRRTSRSTPTSDGRHRARLLLRTRSPPTTARTLTVTAHPPVGTSFDVGRHDGDLQADGQGQQHPHEVVHRLGWCPMPQPPCRRHERREPSRSTRPGSSPVRSCSSASRATRCTSACSPPTANGVVHLDLTVPDGLHPAATTSSSRAPACTAACGSTCSPLVVPVRRRVAAPTRRCQTVRRCRSTGGDGGAGARFGGGRFFCFFFF